ncbi:MAG TPA: Chromate resistance protein ChrB [Actinomycetota bacterium]|nr:Chromate resistance protein ChrB [Actinomycetota bacterium]
MQPRGRPGGRMGRVRGRVSQVPGRDRQGDRQGQADLAELDEEEQSLERLRRWHRELRLRDLLGAPSAAGADQRLKECQAKLEDYTQRVFHAVAGQ